MGFAAEEWLEAILAAPAVLIKKHLDHPEYDLRLYDHALAWARRKHILTAVNSDESYCDIGVVCYTLH